MTHEPLVLEFKETNEYQPLLKGKPQTEGMRSGRVYLSPGESCQEHTTGAHEEQLVFLMGRGQAICGEGKSTYEVGVGKVLYIPPHTVHKIYNSGSEPLVYIYCVTPINRNEDND